MKKTKSHIAKKKSKTKAKKGFADIVGKVVIDRTFRETFFKDKDRVMKGYLLSPIDKRVLRKITPQVVEEAAKKAESTPEWAIGIVISGHFDVK